MNTKLITILALIVSVIALTIAIAPYVKLPVEQKPYTQPNTKYPLSIETEYFNDRLEVVNDHNFTEYRCILEIYTKINGNWTLIETRQLGTINVNSGTEIIFSYDIKGNSSLTFNSYGYSTP